VEYTPFEKQANITIETNFFGTLHVTQTMLPLLQKSTSPRIINIASSAGRLSILKSDKLIQTVTSPKIQLEELEMLLKTFVADVEAGTHSSKGWPTTCYGMSKLGINVMTQIFAREYPSIMVNAVDPGYCATDQNNNQGYLPAKQGATAAVYLANVPPSTSVTGQTFASY
jgi:NAD(P)-dependent dehydrogenase (short-subunit alcohol dehydrogenase family)